MLRTQASPPYNMIQRYNTFKFTTVVTPTNQLTAKLKWSNNKQQDQILQNKKVTYLTAAMN